MKAPWPKIFEACRTSTHGEALAARWLRALRPVGVRGLTLRHGPESWSAGTRRGTDTSWGPSITVRGTTTLSDDERALVAELATTTLAHLGRLHRFARTSREASRDRLSMRARLETLAGESTGLLGVSPAMREARRLIHLVAPHPTSVLLMGETGTGKELAARAIHRLSQRSGRFVAINCGALPEALLESELFGHVEGAFTGAHRAREGVLRSAQGGTVFLDEVAELPLTSQSTLLRALQEREVRAVGADVAQPFDARIVAATHRDLAAAARRGAFREDLYFRLSVFPITLPSLRARPEDIPALVRTKLEAIAARLDRAPPRVTRKVMQRLAAHDWPGNVRELENELERATVLSDDTLVWSAGERRREPGSAGETLDEIVTHAIREALARCGGRIYGERGAAKRLGLAPSTLQTKMAKHGIRRDDAS